MPQSQIAEFGGGISSQLVVGNHIIQIGSIHGAQADVLTMPEQPTLFSLSSVVSIRQNDDNLLDRQELITEVIAALQSERSVELYSPSGFGKTVLLRHLVQNNQFTSLWNDGVISLSPSHPHVGDLLQSMWEAFYDSHFPYKPTPHQIRQQIQEKQALVVLDDGSKLTPEEVEELMSSACRCTFLIASNTSRLQQNGLSIQLSGLSIQYAIALVEQELQRSLEPEELPAARNLCGILTGHPMRLRQAIASSLEESRSLVDIISQLPTSLPDNYLINQIVDSLLEPQKSILELLVIMGDVGLESQQVQAIIQLPDIYNTLETLRRRHLIQLYCSRYSISKTLVEFLPSASQLTSLSEKVILYFTNWVEQHKQQDKILLQIDAIVQIMELAVRANRWSDVLSLAKAVEGSIALSRRWNLWVQVLQWVLLGVQAEQEKATEAWALHQLGTCALCQEDNISAMDYLNKAMLIRQFLGDEMGVSVTRHNLNLLKLPQTQHYSLPLPPLPQIESYSVVENHHNNQPIVSNSKTEVEKPLSSTQVFKPPLAPSSQNLLSRVTIVVEEPSPSNRSDHKRFLLSPTGVIVTGILAAGGLLTWFSWYHIMLPASIIPKVTPTGKIKLSPITKQKHRSLTTEAPIPEVRPTIKYTPAPIPSPNLTIDSPLSPPVESPKPVIKNRNKINPAPIAPSKPKKLNKQSTPTEDTYTPVPAASPTPTVPTDSPTPAITTPAIIPTQEATPTPTIEPTTKSSQPTILEPTPTPTSTATPGTKSQESTTPEPLPPPTFTPTP
ncbi:MAG: hypothetical protein PUP93_10150 [Rhizonema sp. NSF051]|nr:hypothetical protein [Rhizonema sp. NSF051]